MLKEVEELSSTRRRLHIDVPIDVVKSETDSIYNHLRMTSKIPGFRPGKVPQAILQKRFGKNVEAQVIEKIVPEFYMQAIKEANIEPVSYPNIDEQIEIKPGQPLSFSVTVEIKPEVGEIDYSGIVLKKRTFSVAEEEIEKTLKLLQENRAVYSVSEEELVEGDMAIVNSEAYVDDKVLEELSYKGYPLIIGSDEMPKEFSEGLKGRKKGDNVDVTVKFEEDHPNKTIAGKEILFKINIEETKKKHVPPLDDEFAKEHEAENLDELRKNIRENLEKRKQSRINLEYKREILDELIKRHDFDVPSSMLSGELDSLVDQAKQDAMRSGAEIKPDDELRKEFQQKARENVKGVLLLERIGKKENIEVGDDEVKNAIREIAARNDLQPEEVTKLYTVREGSMDALKSRLFADKVLDYILEKSEIKDDAAGGDSEKKGKD